MRGIAAAFALGMTKLFASRLPERFADALCCDLRSIAVTGTLHAVSAGVIGPVRGLETKVETLLDAAREHGIAAIVVPFDQLETLAALSSGPIRKGKGAHAPLCIQRVNRDTNEAHEVLAFGARTIDDAFGLIAEAQAGAVLHL